MFFLGGCKPFRSNAKPKDTPVAVSQEGRPFSLPFLGDDVKGASEAILSNIRPLYRISFIFLGAAGVFGVWMGIKVGLGLALGGFSGLGACVLFSMFPRTVLLVPALGAVFLISYGIWYLLKRGRHNVGP